MKRKLLFFSVAYFIPYLTGAYLYYNFGNLKWWVEILILIISLAIFLIWFDLFGIKLGEKNERQR